MQRPAGDRVKTDARDALHLAKLLRLDQITSVAIPSVDQEAARDLVRAREECRGDLMRARHRLSKLLLRHGIVYYGQAWTGRHDTWLRHVAAAEHAGAGELPGRTRSRRTPRVVDAEQPDPRNTGHQSIINRVAVHEVSQAKG